MPSNFALAVNLADNFVLKTRAEIRAKLRARAKFDGKHIGNEEEGKKEGKPPNDRMPYFVSIVTQ